MKSIRPLIRLLVIILMIATGLVAWSQPVAIREFSEATIDNVVRIEAKWANGNTNTGFGYLVGAAARRMTVATAKHVITQLINSEFQAAQKIEIITRNGKRYRGERVGFSNDLNGIDLGFVDFEADATILFKSEVVAMTIPVANEEVWLLGSKGEIKLSPTSGRVSNLTSSLVRVNALGGVAGVSGAAVLSSRGIVGLYLGGDPIANVLQIGAIKRHAIGMQRVWTLSTCQCDISTIAVQFIRTDTLDIPVSIFATTAEKAYRVPGSYQLAPRNYALNFDGNRVECMPRTFNVEVSTSSQKIEVSCSPVLEGNWSSSEVNGNLTKLGDGNYELKTIAKNNLPSNSLKGRLIQTNTERQFQTNITDLLGRNRSGGMIVSPDLMEMKITIPTGVDDRRILVLKRQQ